MIQSMLELNLLQTEKWPEHSFALPKFQSHRGYCKSGLQENTIESLSEAKKLGFQMAEFDVLLSRDGIPVLFHDLSLSRIAKKNIMVRDLDLQDLKELANVASLKEILQSKQVPDFLNIEIKSADFLKDPLTDAVCDVVRETKSQSRIVISSFNPWCLLKLKLNLPDVPLALLASNEPVKKNYMYLRRMWTVPILRPHLLHLDHEMLNEDFLSLVRQNDLRVASWTVNDSYRADYLIRSGICSIITDENLVS